MSPYCRGSLGTRATAAPSSYLAGTHMRADECVAVLLSELSEKLKSSVSEEPKALQRVFACRTASKILGVAQNFIDAASSRLCLDFSLSLYLSPSLLWSFTLTARTLTLREIPNLLLRRLDHVRGPLPRSLHLLLHVWKFKTSCALSNCERTCPIHSSGRPSRVPAISPI